MRGWRAAGVGVLSGFIASKWERIERVKGVRYRRETGLSGVHANGKISIETVGYGPLLEAVFAGEGAEPR